MGEISTCSRADTHFPHLPLPSRTPERGWMRAGTLTPVSQAHTHSLTRGLLPHDVTLDSDCKAYAYVCYFPIGGQPQRKQQ